MIDLSLFPTYFSSYQWEAKHGLFGYPADSFPEFRWISELERRSAWLRDDIRAGGSKSGLYLLKDVIQWGGSQNGCLQKFEDELAGVCLSVKVAAVVAALPHPSAAIANAMEIPGLGLTYGSKLLRFLDPERYGALDSRLREGLSAYKGKDDRLTDMVPISDNKPQPGYHWFFGLTNQLVDELEQRRIARPDCALARKSTSTGWRAADVEMALFHWALTVRT